MIQKIIASRFSHSKPNKEIKKKDRNLFPQEFPMKILNKIQNICNKEGDDP